MELQHGNKSPRKRTDLTRPFLRSNWFLPGKNARGMVGYKLVQKKPSNYGSVAAINPNVKL